MRRDWKVRVQPNNGTAVTAKAADANGRTHYVTKVTFLPATHVNAKFIKVVDHSATHVMAVLNDLTAAAAVPDVVSVDLGKGFAGVAGEAIDVLSEASGHTTGAWVYVEGYTA